MIRSIVALLLLTSVAISAESLQITTWNVESGGADPSVIAKQLAELPYSDVFALQEVAANDINR